MPQGWQGALPFRYHVGGQGGVKVHLVSDQDYQRRTIWDVIGKVKGSGLSGRVGSGRQSSRCLGVWRGRSQQRDGRDAGGSTWDRRAVEERLAAEAHHGLLQLGRRRGRPDRFHRVGGAARERTGACRRSTSTWMWRVAGPDFSASAVPSLKQFHARCHQVGPEPHGGVSLRGMEGCSVRIRAEHRPSNAPAGDDVRVGDLGSGSDFTPFLQHVGVPSTDIGSGGPYGVYHSVFDNYAWYTLNADPHFIYLQQMARVFGLEALRMADTDVLPYDYVTYAQGDLHLPRDGAKEGQRVQAGRGSISPRRRRQQPIWAAPASGSGPFRWRRRQTR